jgi:DNA replication protein DnaC
MRTNKKTTISPACDEQILKQELDYLKLTTFQTNYDSAAKHAAKDNWTYTRYLAELAHEEVSLRKQHSIERRVQTARFPVLKTLDDFQWDWPKKINRLQIENFFRLSFMKDKSNIIFIGGVGLGKSHLSTALGYQACLKGHSVLFASAIDIINTLTAAHNAGRFKAEMKKYTKPALLIIDELGYLPVDRKGADLLFQVISKRYEQAPIVLTTNKSFKKWPEIFNNDSTLTSAVLDRLLHHAEVSVIEGKSFRMKDRINE